MPATDVVSLADMKAHLRYPADNDTDDSAITSMLEAAVDVLSFHCDDILPTLYTETYNGGHCSLFLRNKPVIEVLSVIDNAGYISYDLALQDVTAVTIGSDGSEGGANATSLYAFSLDDAAVGMITKRTIGNIAVPFHPGIRNVSVVYRAGRTAPYAGGLVMAVKSLVMHWWSNEELRGVALTGGNYQYDVTNQEISVSRRDGSYTMIAGVPNRILELVMAHRRDVIFA